MKPTKRRKIILRHSVKASDPIFWSMLKKEHSSKKYLTISDMVERYISKMKLNSEYGRVATPIMTKFY